MKKNFILVSLVAALGIFSSFSALSYDGTIKFRGTIINEGCTVAAGTAGKEVEVNFGSLSKSAFGNAVDTVAVSKNFSISLQNCQVAGSLGIFFDGDRDTNNNNVFGSGVSGVGIKIFRADGTTEIRPKEYATGLVTATRNTDTDMQFIAKLVSTNTSITPNKINKDIKFTIVYP
ncbi:fimbrial protein [Photorhabdus namnaonensis]|uniref:Type-1 fimbrial protein, A chain n=1 Tax=Photorhabdus namnaonensis TaxID=1851568 RepID=A0A1B8YF68_9GAMM|nr:fimbrial protein [Photorhabdus namnaonensis]OCA53735.1 Type-1 fimbrial protein, A chain precursor [Photorhabdus namnaonensis]